MREVFIFQQIYSLEHRLTLSVSLYQFLVLLISPKIQGTFILGLKARLRLLLLIDLIFFLGLIIRLSWSGIDCVRRTVDFSHSKLIEFNALMLV